jgi:REP element-mobilizing transposase RayT
MPTGYEMDNPAGMYFLTFTVVDWVDVFTRKCHRDIVTDSLAYCRKEKGLKVWGYVIMSNHMHSILSAVNGNLPDVVRDFKRHTASKILKQIQEPVESRRDWMLKRFEFAAKSSARCGQYQFWERPNRAKICETQHFTQQKLNYIHLNPVRAGLVDYSHEWVYSSARNYLLQPGVIDIDLLEYY